MSLLLDALKKAADDKQKALQEDTADNGLLAQSIEKDLPDSSVSGDHTANNQAAGSQTKSDQVANARDASPGDIEELTLDSIDDDFKDSLSFTDEIEGEALEEPVSANKHVTKAELTLEETKSSSFVNSNTVSDEALLLLINKTNREVKKSKRYIIAGVLLLSIMILFTGIFYYYFDMQAEMDSIERKHKIAMQAMRSKTGAGNVAQKSEVIRSFVNKIEPDEKIKLAKKHIANEKKHQNSAGPKINRIKGGQQKESKAIINKSNDTRKNSKGVFSIQKINKSDPLAEKLDAAWLAYGKGRYDESEKLYTEVLRLEKNNRDAILGLSAIAIHNKNPGLAKSYYQVLLNLDPRDPIAIAGVASLHSDKDAIKADKENLLSMLEKNPDAAHLNFALGNIYAQNKEWLAAQKYYFNAWQQDSENADYLFNVAISMDQLGKPQQALKFYTESMSKSENKQVGFSREAVQQRIKVLSEL